MSNSMDLEDMEVECQWNSGHILSTLAATNLYSLKPSDVWDHQAVDQRVFDICACMLDSS